MTLKPDTPPGGTRIFQEPCWLSRIHLLCIRESEIHKASPPIPEEELIYRLARSDYEKEWRAEHEKLGVWTRIFSIPVRILPRVGLLRELSSKASESTRCLVSLPSHGLQVSKKRVKNLFGSGI